MTTRRTKKHILKLWVMVRTNVQAKVTIANTPTIISIGIIRARKAQHLVTQRASIRTTTTITTITVIIAITRTNSKRLNCDVNL